MAEKKKKEEKAKPLEKMTVKDLREVAKTIEGVVGVHAMNKTEIISVIKKARGITEDVKKKDSSIRDIKKKIKAAKEKRHTAIESDDKKMSAIYRRRINRLKKRSRKVA